MIELTKNAKAESQRLTVTPLVVFKLTNLDMEFTNVGVSEYIRIGDPGLEIGDDWVIGGVRLIDGQSVYMMFGGAAGTTTKVNQKISADRGQGSSISSLVISLLDKNEEVTKLISPGFILEDILGQPAIVKIGFENTAYPRDYNMLFNGIVSDVESGPGYINFLLVNSEEKKRRPLFDRSTTETVGDISTGALSSITVVDGSLFPTPVVGPDLALDPAIEYLCRIEDEIFKYTSGGPVLTGITRAYLGSVDVAHEDESNAQFGIRLQGNGIDLALKIMCSGVNGYFQEDVEVRNFNYLLDGTNIQNCIYFDSINVVEDYGLTEGDYVTVTGATNGANNVSMKQIIGIDLTDDGSFVVLDGVAFVDEFNSAALVKFRSKYDSLGIGLGMSPAIVDVKRHEFIRDTFLNNFDFDFRGVFDASNGKEFIEKQIYLPMGCFSVPRGGKASVTYTIGPISDTFIPTISTDNVKNPTQLKPKRSIASNFQNTIEYSFDYDAIQGEYKRIKTFDSPESKERIPIGDKTLEIKSQGIQTDLNAVNIATLASARMLDRYKFGAETITGLDMLFGDGYPIEIGDIAMIDYKDLKMSDIKKGTRDGDFKYFECINKTFDLKTGQVLLDLLNTSFEVNDRFGIISPSSLTDVGSTTTKINLKKSWSTKPYQLETKKWEDYVGLQILVHAEDWSEFAYTTLSALGDESIIVNLLPFIPGENYIVDAPYYPDDIDPNVNPEWKGLHAFFSPNVAVVDSADQTHVEVDPADISKFFVGGIIRINNFDYSDYSPEAEILSVDVGTNIVEFDTASGFTIDSTHEIKLIGFKDEGPSYRYI